LLAPSFPERPQPDRPLFLLRKRVKTVITHERGYLVIAVGEEVPYSVDQGIGIGIGRVSIAINPYFAPFAAILANLFTPITKLRIFCSYHADIVINGSTPPDCHVQD
jgi:hypothetical protein